MSNGWKAGDLIQQVSLTASLVRGDGADEVRHIVGQRLAGINQSRIALGADEEESPLQSKRSSMLIF
jgi:hypothetical protein